MESAPVLSPIFSPFVQQTVQFHFLGSDLGKMVHLLYAIIFPRKTWQKIAKKL